MGKVDNFRSAAFSVAVAVATVGGGYVTTAAAQQLRVGTAYKLMTLDPHYADLNENNALLSNIYERLAYQDNQLNAQPGLAVSWTRLSETQWEFKLREDVQFHDGSPFTSKDVVYTIERIKDFLDPPSGGYQSYTQTIRSVTAPDPVTVLIETTASTPALPLAMSEIFIMPHVEEGYRTTEELNSVAPPIGTGPYMFEGWQSGEVLRLVRNDDYWGDSPDWEDVTFRVIESPAARVAALRTGDVDLADFVPARDVEALEGSGISIESTSAARSNFLQFGLGEDTLPGVTDKSGQPIPNPFRDERVRRALTLATDRALLADKILLGYGTAASQMFPTGLAGTSPDMTVSAPDYEEAKALLAEAGFADGFRVVLGGPAGRYPGDAETLQAIAQNWARIGIDVRPIVAPFSVFMSNRSNGDYPVWYGGCSGSSVALCLGLVLASSNDERGTGSLNYGAYANPEFDEMLAEAESIDEGPERNEALARAIEFVMADHPMIPLYHFHHITGHGQRVASYSMHPRGWTTATQAIPSTE